MTVSNKSKQFWAGTRTKTETHIKNKSYYKTLILLQGAALYNYKCFIIRTLFLYVFRVLSGYQPKMVLIFWTPSYSYIILFRGGNGGTASPREAAKARCTSCTAPHHITSSVRLSVLSG